MRNVFAIAVSDVFAMAAQTNRAPNESPQDLGEFPQRGEQSWHFPSSTLRVLQQLVVMCKGKDGKQQRNAGCVLLVEESP